MDEFDLEIDNYNLNEIVDMFNISNDLTDEDFIKIKNNIEKFSNKSKYNDLHKFYVKANFLLKCVKKYREYIEITKNNYFYSEEDDNYIIQEIKKIPNFFNYNNVLSVINLINNKSQDAKSCENQYTKNKLEELEREREMQILKTQVANTFNYPVTKGDVNYLKRVTQLMNVNLNSCFRQNYLLQTSSNFQYNIPNGGINNVVSMKLLSIEIPNTWFLISHLKKNNRFKIEILLDGICSLHEIKIPDGNHDRDTLVEYINNNFLSCSCTERLEHIEMKIDEFTNRTYFTLVNNPPENFIYSVYFVYDDTDNMLETLGWILGFRLARYIKIDDILISEGLFDGGGDRYIYVSINDYNNNYNDTNLICFEDMSISENIIAKIPLINGKFSLIMNENNYSLIKIRRYNGPVNINKLEIRLLDKFGNIIELNKMDWSLSLELEILYENIMS